MLPVRGLFLKNVMKYITPLHLKFVKNKTICILNRSLL